MTTTAPTGTVEDGFVIVEHDSRTETTTPDDGIYAYRLHAVRERHTLAATAEHQEWDHLTYTVEPAAAALAEVAA